VPELEMCSTKSQQSTIEKLKKFKTKNFFKATLKDFVVKRLSCIFS